MLLCRGCTLSATGAVAGVVVGAALPAASAAVLISGALLFALSAVLALNTGRRASKWLTRALPVAVGAATATSGLFGTSLTGALISCTVGACFIAAMAGYRRRGPDRAACVRCPEAGSATPCSGATPILRRERAFRRLVQRWVDRDLVG